MRKVRLACSRAFRRGKLRGASSGENAQMLPKETQKEKEKEKEKSKGIEKMKNVAVKVLKNLSPKKEETEEMLVDKESGGRQYLSGQAICELIDQAKFLEACNHIYDLEQSQHKTKMKIDSLYKKIAEKMWSVVQEAISGGDNILLEPLKSVGASLKWEKEKEKEWFDSGKDMESVSTWSPKYWNRDLEKLLMECIATQIPSFVSASNIDEPAFKDHLSQLESNIFPNLRCKRDFFKEAELLTTYTKCCNACLLSHFSTLTDGNLSFSKCLLIYEWGFNMYRSGSAMLLLADACYLKWIFSDMEKKLLTVTQKEVREALREVVNAGRKPYTDTTIIQVLTGRSEAVQHISDTIRDKVEAGCLEELLQFLCSYKNETRSLLQVDTFSVMCSNLQILENCCIFRAAWYKLTYIYSASAETDTKVKEFIDGTEEQSRKLFLQAIASEAKVVLKNHFRKDYSDLNTFLNFLQLSFSRFEMKNTQTYETLIQAAYQSIVTEYMQALLTISGKSSSAKRRNIANKIKADHRAMRTLFEENFGPRTVSLDDPIERTIDFIGLTDIEAMKLQIVLLLHKCPDLRKEHLNIILDIKGTLSWTERNTLLAVVYENCVGIEKETDIKTEKYGNCVCCCCF
ncbi:exocyst complex component 3-like isoform X2 [Pelodiscus sinensis]|uniref:exocyst complex component 3-like isoform X2 n=1 Tax=Pelodiscus sinensis TaxID=13735 RepID=UPI003F6D5418